MSELVRKPFVSLLLLVLLNVSLLSFQYRDERGRTLLRSWSLSVLAPIAWAGHSVKEGVTAVFDRYFLLYGAEEENRRLREENEALRLKVTELSNATRFLGLVPDYELIREQYSFTTLPAAVIWKSPPFHSQRIFINAGARNGVRQDAAVLTTEGIVGRVIATTSFSSEVELITNAGAGAGGMLAETNLEGIIRGDGTTTLSWNYIPSYEKADIGQRIYTSGADGIYPSGIPIGRITKSTKGSKVYLEVQVEPFVDFLRLQEVLVVTGK
jgi:rod shape-determining protein MreC